MKIGILTLHDSINYGALLQAYAMRRVYASLGHQAVLIDRRRDRLGWRLKWELSAMPPLRRLSWFLNATGIWHETLRRRRSLDFLERKVGLTAYHFRDWKDAPQDLGVDLVSIGSDQVWNANINDPLDYLPGRIPARVPTVAYAASIGGPRIPPAIESAFRDGARLLRSVMVRERSSVEALERLGVSARPVVDPVVLAGRAVWDELIGGAPASSGRIVVYPLGVDPWPCIERTIAFAERTGIGIDFFVGRLVAPPSTPKGKPRLFKNLKLWRRCRRSPLFRLHLADGPEAFVRAIASARAVVTSSYHALLFSVLYARNVRFVTPDASTPQADMMVRIRDYAGTIVRGPLLQSDLDAALASVADGAETSVDEAALALRRERSLACLKEAL